MKGILGGSIMLLIFYSYIDGIGGTREVISDIDNQVNYMGASYVAEASIEKELLSIKSQDIDKINTFTTKMAAGKKEDMQYGFVHEGADSGYFDLTLNNSPSFDIDLGPMESGDITFENIQNKDLFDTFILNYNKESNKQILVEVIKSSKNSGVKACDVYGKIDGNCSYISKTVINSSDASLNSAIKDGMQIYFSAGEDGYSNKISILGINPNLYNYKITFNTLKGGNTEFAYYVTSGGEKKKIVNNLVEIDTIGNAIESFSRVKLNKRISDDIQPMSKYVLFSDSEIIK